FLLAIRNVRDKRIAELVIEWETLWEVARDDPGGLQIIQMLLSYLTAAEHKMSQETFFDIAKMARVEPELSRNSLA
ncbi:MAG: hypothetical protein FWD57_10490, partial [Polyangiaceae bacterium]|nr:hypothetical protein [Polyangiaceae bacterium]